MPSSLVFDFDGVIVDSEPLHHRAFVRVAKKLGYTMTWEQYLAQFVGYDDRDAFRVMLGHPAGQPAPGDDEKRVADLIQDKAHAFELEVNAGVDEIPGSVALIQNLAGQIPIAIASGATQFDIRIILAKLGLANVFDVTVTADDVERSKPDPESYAKAVKLLAEKYPDKDIIPPKTIAIEDTATGIASARAAGLEVLGLTTTGPAELLNEATRVVPNLQDVTLDRLREWFVD